MPLYVDGRLNASSASATGTRDLYQGGNVGFSAAGVGGSNVLSFEGGGVRQRSKMLTAIMAFAFVLGLAMKG